MASGAFAQVPGRLVSVDLSPQFDAEPREQGHRQSCHAFAAVALLEAARYRMSGERVRLDELTLFTAVHRRRKVPPKEGGLLRDDLRLALEGEVFPLPWIKDLHVGGPSGLRFVSSAFRTAVKNGAVRCADKEKRRDLLVSRLDGGQPVGVGMLLDGASDPDLAAEAGAWGAPHYMVVTGYARGDDGVVFDLRNSWGRRPGWKAKLRESDMCALFGISWVSIPGEPD